LVGETGSRGGRHSDAHFQLDIYRAIQACAKGYLLKDEPREALMDCIRRVHGIVLMILV
jgi:DNA-binding NarL/FixJ family response regulator